MSLDFRTYHDIGMIFYIANLQQAQFVAVQLIDGKIRTTFGAEGDIKVIQSGVSVSDGFWHDVSTLTNAR